MAIVNMMPTGGGSLRPDLLIPFQTEFVAGKEVLSTRTLNKVCLYIYGSSSATSQYVQLKISSGEVSGSPMWQYLDFQRSSLADDGSNSVKIKITATANIKVGDTNGVCIGGSFGSSTTSAPSSTSGAYRYAADEVINKGTVFFVEAIRNGNKTTITTTDESGNVLGSTAVTTVGCNVGLWWVKEYKII